MIVYCGALLWCYGIGIMGFSSNQQSHVDTTDGHHVGLHCSLYKRLASFYLCIRYRFNYHRVLGLDQRLCALLQTRHVRSERVYRSSDLLNFRRLQQVNNEAQPEDRGNASGSVCVLRVQPARTSGGLPAA
jgi:hypothetical protein